MDERLKFLAAYLRGLDSVAELCRRFSVSRKTGHKWIARYLENGSADLIDRSRRPLTSPHAVSEGIERLVVACRQAHPTWGPKKLRIAVARDYPGIVLPSASTIARILNRHGLAFPRRRSRRSDPYTQPFALYNTPNAVWCADFKGDFGVGAGRCYPLTISDGYSRYLLRCIALGNTKYGPSRAVFEAAFREYGLPSAMRTDNGSPFASLAPGGLSKLSVWWIKLGIRPERIAAGHPEQNGRHERMHRTLKAEATRPPRRSLDAQQEEFDRFREEYNERRPHEALDQLTPATVYTPSSRPYVDDPPDPTYPDGIIPRRVNAAGVLMWQGQRWYISTALSRETVGLEDLPDGRWLVYFADLSIGTIHPSQDRITLLRRSVVPVVRELGATDDHGASPDEASNEDQEQDDERNPEGAALVEPPATNMGRQRTNRR
jgi:transposase InsO family protein